MVTPPPLPARLPLQSRPKRRHAGMSSFILGTAAIFAAIAAGITPLAFREPDPLIQVALPLITAVFAFSALFAGSISFLIRPDAKHSRAITGMIAGGFAIIFLGGAALAKGMFEYSKAISPKPRKQVVKEKIVVDPIFVSEGTLSAKDFREGWEKWLQEYVMKDVKKGLEGSEDSELILSVFSGFVRDWSLLQDRPTRKEWNELAFRMNDYDGPFVSSANLIVARRSERPFNTISMSSTITALREEEDNPFLLFFLELQRGELMSRTSNSEEKRHCYRNALNALDTMIAEGWFGAEQVWLLADLTERDHFSELEKTNGDGLMEIYKSHNLPDWFLHYVRGKIFIQKAQQSKGSEKAKAANAEDRRIHNQHLTSARRELERSWELAPQYSFAATEMIQVSSGSSDAPVKEMRIWLDRALRATTDNWPAIQAWLNGMHPQRHGSHEAMLELGEHCLATGRFDTHLPSVYTSVIGMISSNTDSHGIYRRDGVFESINEVIEGYLAADQSAAAQKHWRTTRAAIALRSERYEFIRPDWLALDGHFSEETLAEWYHDRRDLFFWCHIQGGDENIDQAWNFEKNRNYGVAANIYRKLISENQYDAEQKKFLEKWIVLLDLQNRFEEGEEIDLIHEGPDFWQEVEGSYRRNDQNEIVITTPTTRFAIEHFLRIGTDYEVCVTMDTPRENICSGGAGLHFTNRTFASNQWSTCYVRELHSGVRECKIAHYRYSAYLKEEIPKSNVTKVGLTCQLDRWKVSINDEPLHKGTVKVKYSHLYWNSRLCLGGWRTMPGDDFEITYRSLKVKKLKPPEETL